MQCMPMIRNGVTPGKYVPHLLNGLLALTQAKIVTLVKTGDRFFNVHCDRIFLK